MLGLLLLAAMPAQAIDHSAWDRLLKQYVNEQHRVDYSRWKQSPDDLDVYLAALAKPWPSPSDKAALINAYNALTIRWILTHYPIVSIWKTKKPFREARHTINGAKVSLDDIETTLRKMGDPRIHAALVCAARSCPPLRREAYVAEKVDAQLKDNTRQWLADTKLNVFDPKARTASLSPIFKWYSDDFPSLPDFLATHAPQHQWVRESVKIRHQNYHWGLNDTGPLGQNYSRTAFYWDALRNR